MPCKCGHSIRSHDWKLDDDTKEPCLLCDCLDFIEETSERKIKRFIKKGIW